MYHKTPFFYTCQKPNDSENTVYVREGEAENGINHVLSVEKRLSKTVPCYDNSKSID